MVESKRDQLLEAARDLARTHGLGALSVRSVAAAAGVGATTLRNYFPSQALLHQAVVSEFVTVTLADLDILDATRDPAERLFRCVAQFLPAAGAVEESLTGWFGHYRLAFGAEANTMVREVLTSGRVASRQALEGWLRVLAGEGRIRAEDVDAHVTRFLVTVDGLHLTMLAEPERVDLDAARDLLRSVVEDVLA